MSEEIGARVRVGDYELGARYQEVGPELGRLYEARNVRTGRPAWVLMPGPGAKWELSGPWSLRVAHAPRTPPSAWRRHALRGLLFLALMGLGLAVGYALWPGGWR